MSIRHNHNQPNFHLILLSKFTMIMDKIVTPLIKELISLIIQYYNVYWIQST